MKNTLYAILVSVVLASLPAESKPPIPSPADRSVVVLTQNVYGGVDDLLDAVPQAGNAAELAQRVTAVYEGYFERDFHERAASLARTVDAIRPDLIALQEAILVRTQSPADGPATPATAVALDYVQILLDALVARGLQYEIVVQSANFDAELPSSLGFDVRHTDREVILARSDLKVSDLKLSNAQGANFTTTCVLPTPALGTVAFTRGWVSVDVKVRGKQLRLISAHLDVTCLPFTTAIQQAQAAELLAGPAATTLPVVLVGDLNSPADGTGPTYNDLAAAGFVDAAIGTGATQPTCCQAADLLNPASLLDTRIDLILIRGNVTAVAAEVVGDSAADRTPSGLWPSDHAGVAATLRMSPR